MSTSSSIPSTDILPDKHWHESEEAQQILASFAIDPPTVIIERDWNPHNRGKAEMREYVGVRAQRLKLIQDEFSLLHMGNCDKAFEASRKMGGTYDEIYDRVRHLYDRCNELCSPRLQEVIAASLTDQVGEAA